MPSNGSKPEMMKQLAVIAPLLLCGCIGIFANDFEIDFGAELVGVESVTGITETFATARASLYVECQHS